MSEPLIKYQAKLMWFQAFTGWEPVLDEPGETDVFKAADVEQIFVPFLKECIERSERYSYHANRAHHLLASLKGQP